MKLKDKLASVEAELETLRDDHAAKQKKVGEARDAFAGVEFDTTSKEFEAAEKAVRDAGTVADAITAKTNEQISLLRIMGDTSAAAEVDHQRRPAGNSTDPRAEVQGTWDSSELLAGHMDRLTRLSSTTGGVGRIELGRVASREAMAAEIGTGTVGGMIRPDYRGVLPPIQRPLDILDLVSTGTTDSNSIEYVQTTGINSGAAETAEGQVKPELALTFTDADAPVRTIAGWLKLRKQVLRDAPALRSFVDGQLRYAVRRRLNDQVINGDGAGQNLRGIRQTTGVQKPTVTSDMNILDRILRGYTVILLTEQTPTGVGVNPLKWESILTLRDRSGGADNTGGYLGGGPFTSTFQTVWGLPLVASQAFPLASGMVGDWTQLQVLIREGVAVLFSDSDQDDFIRNRVTMLGEMAAAVLAWRPDAFADVNLGAVS